MTFALITEGVSEHRIIKHILTKYFKDYEPDINQIQPKLLDNKQDNIGGWSEVLKYCEREEDLKDIFIENDFLVIQIDSDESQNSAFGITWELKNGEVNLEKLHSDILLKLKELIKTEIQEKYQNKIFFAICVHTIECWLLPIFYTDNHRENPLNCPSSLNRILARKGMNGIPSEKNSPNAVKAYDAILKNMKRKKDIEEMAQYNIGFRVFVDSLRDNITS